MLEIGTGIGDGIGIRNETGNETGNKTGNETGNETGTGTWTWTGTEAAHAGDQLTELDLRSRWWNFYAIDRRQYNNTRTTRVHPPTTYHLPSIVT